MHSLSHKMSLTLPCYYSQYIHFILLTMGPKSHTMRVNHRVKEKKEHCFSSMNTFHQIPPLCSVDTVSYYGNNNSQFRLPDFIYNYFNWYIFLKI